MYPHEEGSEHRPDADEGAGLSRTLWQAIQPVPEQISDGYANKAVLAANRIEELAKKAGIEERLGSKNELRRKCGVSEGTFNQALQIAQGRGVVTLRRGPGGGVFAARQAPLVKLGNKMMAIDTSESIVADAQRMRNALDPLVLEDALMHSSATDVLAMRAEVEVMKQAMANNDVAEFLRSNWRFQASISNISPNVVLRSFFLTLLEILERHAVTMPASPDQPLEEVLAARFSLYERMANAMEDHDRDAVMQIMHEHNTGVQPAAQTRESIGSAGGADQA
ncbi:FadR/GntR family transcriptional regulator [Pseudarthrobacter raffinosi]|uniref:FadR/GntR family transcriptional regulator n=1 Tax=Pseudarthrobacter raffinosi TaxID=2953651 RepID=UPI00208F2B30|nr:FCD domain-containing protein [Pseudarthrobacter sp. MDT3-9]MCO4251228.1 FCD domain-containing protein [Pseudarthrobacter sp. MDT3-9]